MKNKKQHTVSHQLEMLNRSPFINIYERVFFSIIDFVSLDHLSLFFSLKKMRNCRIYFYVAFQLENNSVTHTED